MYEINQEPPNSDFQKAWSAAGQHLAICGDKNIQWLRANLYPPICEHLSFRLGNQIFFVFLVGTQYDFDSMRERFLDICDQANARPCLMPMKYDDSAWLVEHKGWGLLDADTLIPMNPLDFVSEENILMSDWEIQDMAVQVVRDSLSKRENTEIMSFQSAPGIDPSLWYSDESGPHFVVIRGSRAPLDSPRPDNTDDIIQAASRLSQSGFFASVTIASASDPMDPARAAAGLADPVYRGHALNVRFIGLDPL